MLHIVDTAVIGMDYLRLGMHVSIELHPLILSVDRSLIGDPILDYVSEPKRKCSHLISSSLDIIMSHLLLLLLAHATLACLSHCATMTFPQLMPSHDSLATHHGLFPHHVPRELNPLQCPVYMIHLLEQR